MFVCTMISPDRPYVNTVNPKEPFLLLEQKAGVFSVHIEPAEGRVLLDVLRRWLEPREGDVPLPGLPGGQA